MDRFRSGHDLLNTNVGTDWPTDRVMLASEEMPDFIKKEWGYTNSFGEVYPIIKILSKNGQPAYVVLDWLEWELQSVLQIIACRLAALIAMKLLPAFTHGTEKFG